MPYWIYRKGNALTLMKLFTLTTAALAAVMAMAPVPAQAGEALLGIRACGHVKAGIPAARAITLAAASDPSSMADIRRTGATSQEAAQMILGVMQTMCGEYITSSRQQSDPKISEKDLAVARANARKAQQIAARKDCSNKLNAANYADRLTVLMTQCK